MGQIQLLPAKTNNKKSITHKMKSFFLILVSIFISLQNTSAQSAEELFAQANQAYQAKNYSEAIKKYEAILAKDLQSAELHYNLGNAYYRTNTLGKAILNYEKALKIAPGNEDIQKNLEIAESQKQDDITTLPPFFLTQWWNGLSSVFSSTIWGILTLLFLWLSAAGWALWIRGATRESRKKGFTSGIVLLIIAFLPLLLGWNRLQQETNSQEAIIIIKTTLHSAPDADSQEIIPLHQGTKVQLLDKIDTWYKVKLGDGEQGWLAEEVIGKI